jgi:GxxExxY protein
MSETRFLCKQQTYEIIGACFEVYNEKGCGFLEPVYQECLELELASREMPFKSQVELALDYKGRRLKQTYKPDFICFGKVILEIKAVSTVVDEHRAQLINYLHATGLEVGLLVNFGHHPRMEYERLVNTIQPPNLRKSASSAGKLPSQPDGGL